MAILFLRRLNGSGDSAFASSSDNSALLARAPLLPLQVPSVSLERMLAIVPRFFIGNSLSVNSINAVVARIFRTFSIFHR